MNPSAILEARVQLLEGAISQAIEYLSRLPIVPATREQIRQLEAALAATDAAPTVETWEGFLPAGLLALQAELTAAGLQVRMPLPRQHAQHLWTALSGDGLTLARSEL